ncbi:hypothetical protein [Pseudolysinimonas yzui]|uniref:DUF2721 domain-containing protein n=1 Tax=Pseudolysinimonas yzui TaxID=2708254 RepID=A0A8J3GQ95_9MICO|nr:hypothetical protein [Pseudolysinimonas yzui]GHF14839.1 hypothetical protein GCM10011600_14750 [Pseudolysinimonas yzui]
MNEIVAAVIGGAAVVLIPLFAWSSQRLTREGRLLLRVHRLGSAFAVMPESPEKKDFEGHLRRAVADLNEWVSPAKKAQRAVVRFIAGSLYILGVAGLFITYQVFGIEDSILTSLLGVLIGAGVAAASLMVSNIVQRVAAQREDDQQREERMERIRLGKAPGGPEVANSV